MDKNGRLYNFTLKIRSIFGEPENTIVVAFKILIGIAVFLLLLGSILCSVSGVEPTSFVISLHSLLNGVPMPLAITMLGIFFLLFAPLLGIILCMVAFFLAKEKLYLAISVAILCLIVGLVLVKV